MGTEEGADGDQRVEGGVKGGKRKPETSKLQQPDLQTPSFLGRRQGSLALPSS